jgi:hypothetical protein
MDGGEAARDRVLMGQAACLCVSRIAEGFPHLAQQHFLPPLLGPFTHFLRHCTSPCNPDHSPDPAAPAITEEEVERAIARTSAVLALRTCSAEVHGWVASVLVPLFRLFCLASRTKSFLKTPVQNILLIHFKTGAPEDSAQSIMRLLRPIHDAVETLAFCPGPSGGAVIRHVPASTTL